MESCRARHSAFTLLELLVVMGIIALLLLAVIPAVTSISKSSGRKGAINNLLGAIEQARTEAIKTGQAAYIVFPAFATGSQTTLDRYNYKSYAIFQDDPANPATPKQLANWKTFATGVALRAAGPTPLSDLADPATLTPAVTFKFTPEEGADTSGFRCIKFNANGEVEGPAGTGKITLAIFEGYVNGGTEVVTSARTGGEPAATESITIARLTGRAERGP